MKAGVVGGSQGARTGRAHLNTRDHGQRRLELRHHHARARRAAERYRAAEIAAASAGERWTTFVRVPLTAMLGLTRAAAHPCRAGHLGQQKRNSTGEGDPKRQGERNHRAPRLWPDWHPT